MKTLLAALLLVIAADARGSTIHVTPTSFGGWRSSFLEVGEDAGLEFGPTAGDGLIQFLGYTVTSDAQPIVEASLSVIPLPLPGEVSVGMRLCFEGTFDGLGAMSGGTCSSGMTANLGVFWSIQQND